MKFKNPFKALRDNKGLMTVKAEYGYLTSSFFIPAIIMLAIYLAIGHKPLGDQSVLTLDLNAQYVYFYEALREFVWGDASLLYSFSRSLGGEFMGIYAYYVASPLSYIVCLFPKSMMLFALLTIIVVKIGLCGLSFGFYLHKQTDAPDKGAIVLFSTMYALSSYAITYQNNIMWLDGLFLLPILTYSIEQLIKHGKYKLYVAVLALMMMSHYYIGYMMCWYTLFCFFFTYFKDSDRTLVNPTGRKCNFIKTLSKMCGATVLGIGISAFMICAAYYSLQFGKSDFSEPSWDLVSRFDLFDLFPKMLPGAYDSVMHEGLPLLYSGVLTLLMIPIFIMARRVTAREKIFYISFALLYVLLMVTNPLDLVMHGFQEPNCLNYRYSFILIFLMVVMAYRGFHEILEHSPKKVFATGAALVVLVLIAQKMEFSNFMLEDVEGFEFGFVKGRLHFLLVVFVSIIAILAVGAAVCYFIKSDNKQRTATVLLCVVCVELFANGVILTASLALEVGHASYSSYADYFEALTPIVKEVQEKDPTFFRSEKTTHRCTNDNMALNIKGLSNSTSTLNQKVIDLLEYLGFYADAHWTQYIGSTVVTDSLFGIKYIYSNTANEYDKESLAKNEFMDRYFEKFAEDENYYAYKNPYSLGIGFGVDGAIRELETDLSYDYSTTDGCKNPFEVQNALLNTLLGNTGSDEVEFFSPIELTKGIEIIGISSSIGLEYSASSASNPDKTVDFKFTVKKSGPLYLFLPTGYERSFTVDVNDEHYVSVPNYSRTVFLGYREAGEDICVSAHVDESNLYIFKSTNYFYTLDMEAFEAAYEKLSQTTVSTDSEDWSDDHFFGTVTTATEDQIIMTTIPYDAGWRIYVDGERVDTYAVYGDSLLAFDIASAGEHEIEFRYMPEIYVVGAIISAVSVIIFIVLIIIGRIKTKGAAAPIAVQSADADNTDIADTVEDGNIDGDCNGDGTAEIKE